MLKLVEKTEKKWVGPMVEKSSKPLRAKSENKKLAGRNWVQRSQNKQKIVAQNWAKQSQSMAKLTQNFEI